jgi:fatty-acid desaturase
MATAVNIENKYVPHQIPFPPTLERRLIWPYVIAFSFYHAMALLAVVPWLFSWAGLTLWILGFYVFGTLGINLCYHRLLTHRSFNCPRWLEHFFAIIGVCCLQDTPARWVAVHRLHHQHSDEPGDPHSPLAGFFWGHMGWLLANWNACSFTSTIRRTSCGTAFTSNSNAT